jgi:hypothetical protein
VLTPAVLARIFCPWVRTVPGQLPAAAAAGGLVKLLDTRRPYPNFQPWRRVYACAYIVRVYACVYIYAFGGRRIKGPRGGDGGATRDQ